ncbi:MAG: hypothetical protein V4632_13135 [Pseudomonadota bacterium]
MKNKMFGLLAFLSLCQAVFAQAPAPAAQVSRYQMMSAPLTNPPDAGAKQSARLLILDTFTGALTACDYIYNDGGKNKEDGREYWGANGICAPFSTEKGWYVPKAAKK